MRMSGEYNIDSVANGLPWSAAVALMIGVVVLNVRTECSHLYLPDGILTVADPQLNGTVVLMWYEQDPSVPGSVNHYNAVLVANDVRNQLLKMFGRQTRVHVVCYVFDTGECVCF
jgi:hypothetical protein